MSEQNRIEQNSTPYRLYANGGLRGSGIALIILKIDKNK